MNSPNPAASVLMAVYNETPRILEVAVNSVLQQTFSDFEFVIVDDGSERSETVEALARLAASDSRIRIFREPHRGVTKATNFGLLQCRGEFVFRHDSDDWSELHRFSMQVDFLRSHPEIALVGAATMGHQENGRPLWARVFPATHEEIARTLPLRNCFANGSVCFRRQAMEAIGGYREDLRYALDYDCYWRMTDRYPVANLPETLYHYRFACGSISAKKRREQERCAAITRQLGAMRRNGGTEDMALAIQRADAWLKEKAVDADTLLEADHTMLAGAYRPALGLYLKSAYSKPFAPRTWLKLMRCFLFAGLPPLRCALFNQK
jgi:hypothetical protein